MDLEKLDKEIEDYKSSNGSTRYIGKTGLIRTPLNPNNYVFEMYSLTNKDEAFERYFGYSTKVVLKYVLKSLDKNKSLETILSEIKNEIYIWENDADLYKTATTDKKKCSANDIGLNYIRLKSGYFENLDFTVNFYEELKKTSLTYATYFLLKDWLELEIKKPISMRFQLNNIDHEDKKNSENDFEKMLSSLESLDNKFCKGLPMASVIKHFKVMTKRKSENGEPYLTNEQFISFLRKGFLNDTSQPKQIINCGLREKGFVIKRFYDFYELAVSKYHHPHKTESFISLFTDCFNNWEQKTIKSFFKPNKTKKKW